MNLYCKCIIFYQIKNFYEINNYDKFDKIYYWEKNFDLKNSLIIYYINNKLLIS